MVRGWAQYRFAAGVLVSVWWLRRAVDGQASPGPAPEVLVRPVPLLCRWHVRHLWRLEFPDEGRPHTACARCGKEPLGVFYHPSELI